MATGQQDAYRKFVAYGNTKYDGRQLGQKQSTVAIAPHFLRHRKNRYRLSHGATATKLHETRRRLKKCSHEQFCIDYHRLDGHPYAQGIVQIVAESRPSSRFSGRQVNGCNLTDPRNLAQSSCSLRSTASAKRGNRSSDKRKAAKFLHSWRTVPTQAERHYAKR